MINNIYKKIYKQIKNHQNIVIARHIGVDPDAMASQIGLREIIKYNFPNKNVYAIGNGSVKFNFIGLLDKTIGLNDLEDVLLIVVDTPDKRRTELLDFENYKYSIKIDHHPFIEKFCDIEQIADDKSSASEMIIDLVNNTRLKMNKKSAEVLFMGIVSDTNRFLFNSANAKTFSIISNLLKEYELDINSLYTSMYLKPLNEIRLQGYMALNMEVSENGVGSMKINNDIINKFSIDSASVGNLINNFNFIEEVLVWVTVSEDLRNDCIRISIRSRGPIINKIAEKYNGGGHKFASGARVANFEEADSLIDELDELCEKYIKKVVKKNESK